MMRWIAWLAAGVFLGGIAHIATVLLLPSLATRDAYARLAAVTQVNQATLLPQPVPGQEILPFGDPSFATAVCRFDLTDGAVKLEMPLVQTYSSATFYTRRGIAFYAINDRAAGRRAIELDLMTAEQRGALQEDEEVTAADRLIVVAPAPVGLLVMRALVPEPAEMPVVRALLGTAKCEPPSA